MERPSWQECKYTELFEAACAMVRRRRRTDPTFTIDSLRGLLKTAYAAEADGWPGKTTIETVSDAATIAAYEAMLHEWQQETKP